MNRLNKEEFCECMKNIEKAYNDTCRLFDILNSHGNTFPEELWKVNNKLLHVMFQDKGEWIDYWMYELNFGKKYKDGSCTYADGSKIDLSTASALYDFLLLNMGE